MVELDDRIRVAIVGAGLSGLGCANALADRGHAVRVFDKGRSPGGRASTRRTTIRGLEVGFDHGAQYFTARSPTLMPLVEEWERKGVAAPWRGRIAVLGEGGSVASYSAKARYVGVPGMSALCADLARGQDVRCAVTVGRVEPFSRGVALFDQHGGPLGEFDAAVITAPPAQTRALIAQASPDIAAAAGAVAMKPCWAVMAAFDRRLDLPYDGAFVNAGPLSWLARTSSKPKRAPMPDRWVMHGSASWSAEHLEDAADSVATELLHAFVEATGVGFVEPLWMAAHRWRYALAETPIEGGCLFDPSARIAACGDWTHGNRVEGALLAGLAAAQRIEEPRRNRRHG